MESLINLRDLTSAIPPHARGGYLAIGNFDGVHVGHLRLIERLRAHADAKRLPAVAMTFDPHPIALLRPDALPLPINTTERNIELLKAAGASEVAVFRTGDWLLKLTAREFFQGVVLDQFGAVGLVEGSNFGFGRDREGNVSLLEVLCLEAHLTLEIVPPVEIEGRPVSSSRIRKLLGEGNIDEAAKLLGRCHRLSGLVTHGAGRGAGLGFPTANLEEIETLIPLDGVYATTAYVEGRPYAGACHIGPNISFEEQNRKVEVHLIDFQGDLYGKTLEIDFLKRLRGSRKFEGLDDLLGQIGRDVAEAKQIFMQSNS